MARINVEQKALTDPRFEILGQLLGSDRHGALGRMVRIWNECQEHSTYFLESRYVIAILEHEKGPLFLVESNLAEWSKRPRKDHEGELRIKGTEGRIEWLAAKRASAKKNGRRGGRPPRSRSATDAEPSLVSSGLPRETPPAPTPTPAPALSPSESHQFEAFWNLYPASRRGEREIAVDCWDTALDGGADSASILAGLRVCLASDEWRRDDGRWVPSFKKFFAAEGWKVDPPAGRSQEPTLAEIVAAQVERRLRAEEERRQLKQEE